MYACQLQRQDKNLEKATLHLQRIRFKEKERHDNKHSICVEELIVGQVVLLYNTRCKKDISWKLSFKWLGLYRICNAVKNKGTYIFEELNKSRLFGTFADDRLKSFYPWQRLHLDHASNLDDFLLSNGNNNLSDVPDNLPDPEYG